ncbi:hypothetical protein [Rhodoglobus sp.]
MSEARSVVIVFGSGFDAAQHSSVAGEKSVLQRLIAQSDKPTEYSLISMGFDRHIDGIVNHVDLTKNRRSRFDRFLTASGAQKLRNRLADISLGRLLNNMGPLDPSRVFWRAVKRSPEARALLRNADVVIAADLAAVKTAWIAQRRYRTAEAHYDHRAASVGVAFQLPTR